MVKCCEVEYLRYCEHSSNSQHSAGDTDLVFHKRARSKLLEKMLEADFQLPRSPDVAGDLATWLVRLAITWSDVACLGFDSSAHLRLTARPCCLGGRKLSTEQPGFAKGN